MAKRPDRSKPQTALDILMRPEVTMPKSEAVHWWILRETTAACTLEAGAVVHEEDRTTGDRAIVNCYLCCVQMRRRSAH